MVSVILNMFTTKCGRVLEANKTFCADELRKVRAS